MIAPILNRVLLRREKFTMHGSIMIPGAAQKRMASLKCEVVAVGETCIDEIKPGMTVIIGRYAGDWFREDGSVVAPDDDEASLFIVNDEDILAEIRNG